MIKSNVSVILTIHNKEFLIARVLEQLVSCASPSIGELHLIFDGCTDSSKKTALAILSSLQPLFDIRMSEVDNIYEVRANNLGLQTAQGDYSIIVQDDMVIMEHNFDQVLLRPFVFQDVFAVTGRLALNLKFSPGSSSTGLIYCDYVGQPGSPNLSATPIYNNEFAIRDVVNRGPLILDMKHVRALGFFDEAFAPLNLDDVDLCYRAYAQNRLVCGAVQFDYISDLSWGGTRHPSSAKKYIEPDGSVLCPVDNDVVTFKNEMLLIERHFQLISGAKHNEIRLLPEEANV